tara:strand:- start:574 stop:849 length:276 start_codon:yes stop_codon:yes gene_type:complete
MNRQQRRQLQKSLGPKASQELGDQIALFNKLPETCLSCQEPFDKTNKEMVSTWKVLIRQEVVRLFCPHCVEKTPASTEDFIEKNSLGESNE